MTSDTDLLLAVDLQNDFCPGGALAVPRGLAAYLGERGFRRLYLAGLAPDYCVAYSALDAIRAGFAVVVLEDACRAIDLEGSLAWAMDAMRSAGAAIASTADAL